MSATRFYREGRCAECKRRRLVGTVQRFGGGSYKRGGRWYSTSVCEGCAAEAVDYCDTLTSDPSKVYMMSTRGLRDLLDRPRPTTPKGTP